MLERFSAFFPMPLKLLNIKLIWIAAILMSRSPPLAERSRAEFVA